MTQSLWNFILVGCVIAIQIAVLSRIQKIQTHNLALLPPSAENGQRRQMRFASIPIFMAFISLLFILIALAFPIDFVLSPRFEADKIYSFEKRCYRRCESYVYVETVSVRNGDGGSFVSEVRVPEKYYLKHSIDQKQTLRHSYIHNDFLVEGDMYERARNVSLFVTCLLLPFVLFAGFCFRTFKKLNNEPEFRGKIRVW